MSDLDDKLEDVCDEVTFKNGQSPWRICAEILYAGKYYE